MRGTDDDFGSGVPGCNLFIPSFRPVAQSPVSPGEFKTRDHQVTLRYPEYLSLRTPRALMTENGTLMEREGFLSPRRVTAVVPGGWKPSGSRSNGASMRGSWYLTKPGFWELRPPGILCCLPTLQGTAV